MELSYKIAYFFSDAHLNTKLTENEYGKRIRMLGLFDRVKKENAMLCIVGDLFDFWFEYKHAVLGDYFEILFKLRELIQAGIHVHYVAGNHDLWLNSFFEQAIGVKVHKNCFSTDVGGKKSFVIHGDGILKTDYGYRFLKKIFTNKICVSLFRLLHPDLGVPIALFFSRQSREYTADKTFYGEQDYQEFAQTRINNGYDYVIIGHTHKPQLVSLDSGHYLNTGNWMYDFSYVRIDQNGPMLLYWDQKGAPY